MSAAASSFRRLKNSGPASTLLGFAAVSIIALPVFITAKKRNDTKKRERHMAQLQKDVAAHEQARKL